MGATKPSTKCPIKTAKKILKKQELPSLKLKALTKSVIDKLGDEHDLKKDDIRQLIVDSDLFVVEGKLVSLNSDNKKREAMSTDGDDFDDKKRVRKKSKKDKKKINDKHDDNNSDKTCSWRKKNKIVLKAPSADETSQIQGSYQPYSSFTDANCIKNMSSIFLNHCTKTKKFSHPTPIQAQCWSVLSDGRDVVGIAETGSGKTLAFALPMLSTLQEQHSSKNPRMLVLAPTRELAMQNHAVIEEFGTLANLSSIVLYGGVSKHAQIQTLRRGVDIVVATPGRLKDLIYDDALSLADISHLVLDEADRMLDMGFEEDVKDIISHCRSRERGRHTAMFSATWPACIRDLAMTFMTNPLRVYVGFNNLGDENDATSDSLSANPRVTQCVEVINDRERDARLRSLLKNDYHSNRTDRVLVFALYKKEAARLEMMLKRDGWSCGSIHGDKPQEARTKALADFKSAKIPLLVATDVAARGLDIPNVQVVINYTFPLTIEDYVHRIGRTGRAGMTGVSHTFFQPGDKTHAGALQQVLRQAGQEIPEELMKFGSTIKKKEHKLYGNFGPKGGVPMKKATKIKFDF